MSLCSIQATYLIIWVLRGSNPRHSPCKGDALPAELSTRLFEPHLRTSFEKKFPQNVHILIRMLRFFVNFFLKLAAQLWLFLLILYLQEKSVPSFLSWDYLTAEVSNSHFTLTMLSLVLLQLLLMLYLL